MAPTREHGSAEAAFPTRRLVLGGLLVAVVLGSRPVLPGQQVKVAPQAGFQLAVPGAPAAATATGDDDRPALVLPESTDLNRVLRKVNDYFAQTPPKWDEGARMLQDLLEGRVIKAEGDHVNDPFYSVYSEDERLYVPFARYCQQLLARLPAEGLEAYRFLCDGRARAALDEVAPSLDLAGLQRASDLYFATRPGREIVALLADLCLLRGEIERSVHLRAWLLSWYPDLSDATVVDLQLRQAHACSLLGDAVGREAAFKALLDRDPNLQVDLAGRRLSLAALAEDPAFALRHRTSSATAPVPPAGLGFSSVDLQLLWRYEFANKDPYLLKPRGGNPNQNVIMWGQQSWAMPRAKDFRPGTSVTVLRRHGQAIVATKDHDRLVLLDLVSGRVLGFYGGSELYKPSQNMALRTRLPAIDFGLQAIYHHEDRLYCTTENKQSGQQGGDEFPFSNQLHAFDLSSGTSAWTAKPSSGEARICFEAPPVAYGDYLYVPIRKGLSFGLAQLDRGTGDILNVVHVHSGGTSLLRVPCLPPVRAGNQLVFSTNAGAVGAYSLPDLKLLWLRRYETREPHQPAPRRAGRGMRSFRSYGLTEVELSRWKPLPPILHGGRVIVAPIDSDALLCLDAHSGDVVWLLPREEKARNVRFQEVVGHDGERLYLAGDQLQCVDMTSGKRLWEVAIDALPRGKYEGHGSVVGGHVYLPFQGGVYRLRTGDGAPDGVIEFPAGKEGDANWGQPVRLQIEESVLFAVTESGVAAYSAAADLVKSASDAADRVRRLVACGQVEAAWRAILELGPSGEQDALLVRLAGELAAARRREKGRAAALEILDLTEAALAKSGRPIDPRLLLFRVDSLDPENDAREIRTLRDRIASLRLDMGPSQESR